MDLWNTIEYRNTISEIAWIHTSDYSFTAISFCFISIDTLGGQ